MTTVHRILFANFIGSAWSTLLALAVLPISLRILGVEAYGLVGVFATLLSLLSPFEAGLATALNRELAGRSVRAEADVPVADVVRTLEWVYWGFAFFCGALVAAAAPFIAHHWVRPHLLSPRTVQTAVLVMGLIIVFQWPSSLYAGGLTGLQRQVALNVINGIAGTIRSGGTVVILLLVSPTVIAYFLWHIAASAVQTVIVAVVLWNSIGGGTRRAHFRLTVLRRFRRFVIGMSGISLAVLGLTQLDKAILSHVLPLATFGYYALAAGVAANLLRLVGPVQQAVFPRFTALAAIGDQTALTRLYHQMSQLLAVLTVPMAAIIIVFSREVLFVWTGDPLTAQRTATVLSLLMAGTMVNALLYPCYTLQIAHAWTRLIFTTTVCAAVFLVPALIVLAIRFGAVGAATIWLTLNMVFVIVLVPLMHRRLLQGEMRRWLRNDFLLPIAVAMGVAAIGRLLLPSHLARLPLFIAIFTIGLGCFCATLAVTGHIRAALLSSLGRRFLTGSSGESRAAAGSKL